MLLGSVVDTIPVGQPRAEKHEHLCERLQNICARAVTIIMYDYGTHTGICYREHQVEEPSPSRAETF